MATVFRATCPKCKQSIALPATELPDVSVVCSVCQHRFLARMPPRVRTPDKDAIVGAKPRQIHADLHLDIPPLDLSSAAPSQQFWKESRQGRRYDRRAIAIVLGVTLGLGAIVAIAIALNRNWTSIAAIDWVGFGETEDTCSAIFRDWSAIEAKQQALIESIDHKSDCGPLTLPLESLIERQQRLVTRAIRYGFFDNALGASVEPQQPLLLPDFPVSRSKRRPVEVYLTPEFRNLEARLNSVSDVVLAYLNIRGMQPVEPVELARGQFTMHIQLLESLASLEQGSEPENVTVTIYQLTEQMKALNAQRNGLSQGELSSPDAEPYLSLFRSMRNAIRERYAADPGSSLAKALTAFEQLVAGP